jgi:hypothetical protein
LYEKNPNSLTSANTYYQESYEYDEHVYYDAWSDVPAYFGADDDYESESSCMSNDSEPIDFSDITMLEPNKAGELIYLQHRVAKRRWRRFQGGQRRFRRRSGKGKKGFGGKFGGGKSRPKGKGKGIFTEWQTPTDWQYDHVYNTTAPRRTNPLGPDGKPLRCSICDSTEHFRARCPRAPKTKTYAVNTIPEYDQTAQALQNEAIFAMNQPTSQQHHHHQQQQHASSSSSGPWHGFVTVDMTSPALNAVSAPASRPHFMSELQPTLGDDSCFHSPQNWPKTPAPTAPPNLERIGEPSQGSQWFGFPWWVTGSMSCSYHTAVQLPGLHEGLMVDTGAIDNLTGDGIVGRLTKLLKTINRTVIMKPLAKILGVSGVGQNSSECSMSATVYGVLADGSQMTFTAPVISNSEVPALLGLQSLQRQRAVVDTTNRKLYLMGPGGYTINISPGSTCYDLREAPTGHLLLPITNYK